MAGSKPFGTSRRADIHVYHGVVVVNGLEVWTCDHRHHYVSLAVTCGRRQASAMQAK